MATSNAPAPTPPAPGSNLYKDGIRQVTGGLALIARSRLLTFDSKTEKFSAVHEKDFEDAVAIEHAAYGRVMFWILFSTGSEYLLKGCLILTGYYKPAADTKLAIPGKDIAWTSDWMNELLANSGSTQDVYDYGTLGKMNGPLEALSVAHGAPADEPATQVRVAYKVLANAIRNRDAHAYHLGVRADHFHMTSYFSAAFTTLVGWLTPSARLAVKNMSKAQDALTEKARREAQARVKANG